MRAASRTGRPGNADCSEYGRIRADTATEALQLSALHPVPMERLERLVVHIEEALRLARFQDEAHMRLALMLLDSAAELILHRAVQGRLTFHSMHAQLLHAYDHAEQQGIELDEAAKKRRAELQTKVHSRSKLKDLDRIFDTKAEYLVDLGDLPEAVARVLRKLHIYRNEAYHRDRVRSGSLRSAVNIYSYLVCTMLRDLNVTGIVVSRSMPVALEPYFGENSAAAGLEAPRRIAEMLLASSGMDRQEELGIALGNHLDDRLEAMIEGLEEIAGFLSDSPSHEEWDAEAALVLVQVDDQTGAFMTPDAARRTTVSFDLDDLGALRKRAEAVANETDPVRAFAEFADVEDNFEGLEVQIMKALTAIDREVQLQIDIARGK